MLTFGWGEILLVLVVVIVVVVKIFTTEGIKSSAKSAKDEGISFAFTKDDKLIK